MSTEIVKQSNNRQFDFFDPEQFATMQRLCNVFSSSELVPDMYKVTQDNPKEKAIANCMIAIEISQRIGASPLMVMQNMIVIYGRPSWSSKFLVATVNTCGRFEPLEYRFTNLGKIGKVTITEYVWNPEKKKKLPVDTIFDGTDIDNIECVAFTTKKGGKSILESSPVTIMMAIQEGWYTKNASKWRTMTKQMLIYRSASFWTSAYAPDLSMGMRTVEEQQDIIDIDHEDVTNMVEKEIKHNANIQPLSFTNTTPVNTDPAPAPEPKVEPKQNTSPDANTEPQKAPF